MQAGKSESQEQRLHRFRRLAIRLRLRYHRTIDNYGQARSTFLPASQPPSRAVKVWPSSRLQTMSTDIRICKPHCHRGCRMCSITQSGHHWPARIPLPLFTSALVQPTKFIAHVPSLKASGFSEITQWPQSTSLTSNLGKKRPMKGKTSSAT